MSARRRLIFLGGILAAVTVAAHAKPALHPERLVVDPTNVVLAFPGETVGVIDVLDALAAKREVVERCVTRARVVTTGLALMTVDETGSIRRVDVAGMNAATATCVRVGYQGAKLRTQVAGAFTVKLVIAPAPPPPPPVEVPHAPYPPRTFPPNTKVEAMVVQDAFPEREIDRAFKARAGLFRACYEKELTRDPSLRAGGKLVLAVTISADGKVAVVKVAKAFHPAVDACVVTQVQKLVFPASGSVHTITYPLLFSSGS